MKKKKIEKMCEECDHDTATHVCRECGKLYCDECAGSLEMICECIGPTIEELNEQS